MAKTIIIIPVYNEGSNIATVVKSVRHRGFNNLIVVDDGSHTPVKVSGAKVIRHIVNRGKGAAVKTGIAAALLLGGDYLITLDGDGQHAPADIHKVLAQLRHGTDVVLGFRSFSLGAMPVFKIIANHINNWLTGLISGLWVRDAMCGFKAYSRHAAEVINTHQDHSHYQNTINF